MTAFCLCDACKDLFCSPCWYKLHARGSKPSHPWTAVQQPNGIPADSPWPPGSDAQQSISNAAAEASASAHYFFDASSYSVAASSDVSYSGASYGQAGAAAHLNDVGSTSTSENGNIIELPDNAMRGFVQGRRQSVVLAPGRRQSMSTWQEEAHESTGEESKMGNIKIGAVGKYVRRASVSGQLPASYGQQLRVMKDSEAMEAAVSQGSTQSNPGVHKKAEWRDATTSGGGAER